MTLLDGEFFILTPTLVLFYWLTPRSHRLVMLTVLSYLALAYFSIISAAALAVISVISYFCAIYTAKSKVFFLMGFIALVLTFSIYKSYSPSGSGEMALLIGMSFYLLKALHVLIEGYKGRLTISSPMSFFSYMAFFPTLLIGPIHRYENFNSDWMRQSFSETNLSVGLERCLLGYAKLVLLGSVLFDHELSEWIATLGNEWPRLSEYLKNLSYGLHLYFAFAGASDIAIGLGLMMGYKINENFNHPFVSLDIADFWRRWHISLANWCREYIYGPTVSLSRKHQLGIFLTMLGIGLWHEFSARYVLWGCYHGLGLIIYYRWSNWGGSWLDEQCSSAFAGYLRQFLAWMITFNFVMLSFSITRSESTDDILVSFQRLILGL
jgi:alginate O-acetyltransferase complex protein AlgI